MWYGVLPPMFIIGTCIHIRFHGTGYVHNAVYGTPYCRSNNHPIKRHIFDRDMRVGGAPYRNPTLDDLFADEAEMK